MLIRTVKRFMINKEKINLQAMNRVGNIKSFNIQAIVRPPFT